MKSKSILQRDLNGHKVHNTWCKIDVNGQHKRSPTVNKTNGLDTYVLYATYLYYKYVAIINYWAGFKISSAQVSHVSHICSYIVCIYYIHVYACVFTVHAGMYTSVSVCLCGRGMCWWGPPSSVSETCLTRSKKEVTLIFNQCHIFYFPQRFFCHIFVLFGHIFVTFLSYFCHININSWIKGTLWGTLGFDPRFLKGSVKSFYHAKMLVGAY